MFSSFPLSLGDWITKKSPFLTWVQCHEQSSVKIEADWVGGGRDVEDISAVSPRLTFSQCFQLRILSFLTKLISSKQLAIGERSTLIKLLHLQRFFLDTMDDAVLLLLKVAFFYKPSFHIKVIIVVSAEHSEYHVLCLRRQTPHREWNISV